MGPYRFVQVDVFTERAFGGNQLAVFTDAGGLATEQMQAIAREMNFSESAFVFPAEDPAHDARVRIFTPGQELPMAGHPTVGTAWVLGAERGRDHLVFELGVGPTAVQVRRGDARSGRAAMEQRVPVYRAVNASPEEVAALVSLGRDALHRSLPVMYGSAGVEYLYVPLLSRGAVAAARANAEAMDRFFGEAFHRAVYVFAPEADETSSVRGRMFFLVNGAVLEDPATGSAAGPLGGYLVEQGVAAPGRIRLQQGYEMGRPSDIEVDIGGDADRITSVRVGGGVVEVAEGELFATA